MIEPVRAAVRPRVRLQPSGEIVLLEDVVAEHLAAGKSQTILLCGEVGAGTTAALYHLAECFSTNPGVRFDDSSYEPESPTEDPRGWIIIHSEKPQFGHLIRAQLAGWGRDEWIEYLLAVHHNECASVMRRIQADAEGGELGDNPGLWRQMLDEFAADEALTTIKAALQRVALRMFPDRESRLSVGWRWFVAMVPAQQSVEPLRPIRENAVESHFEKHARLSKPAILLILAAEAIAHELENGDPRDSLRRQWPGRLVHDVALYVAKSQPIQDSLRRLLIPKHRDVHPLAASLLHVSGTGWKPEPPRLAGLKEGQWNLAGAFLAEADWPEVDLRRCELAHAIFTRANLERANLDGANAQHADFTSADLQRAILSRLKASDAKFVGANMTSVQGREVDLDRANLSSADLTEASLVESSLKCANLSRAILRRACLEASDLPDAVIDDADFTEADLKLADLAGLDLTVANFDQARFPKANLHGCCLEGMELFAPNFANADLSKALLTGSVMPNADFTDADLREAGLADIDWEIANLRNADLSGATFHMGSTRSGLVGSTIPMYGSRTGFYTDDYNEQDFKSPEEIRKANLRGADLRGAIIKDTDFYLVDLRDALYDNEQERHFRRCGAILESRAERH